MKILIVDDEPLITESLSMLLDEEYEILTENNPVNALDIVKEHMDIDLIISDFKMPELTGSEFLIKAKEINTSLKCLILTGYGDSVTLKRSVDTGLVARIILKPWSPDALKRIIKQTLHIQ